MKLWEYQVAQFNLPDNAEILNLFMTIEMPMVDVIVDMELYGIGIDKEYAKKMETEYERLSAELQGKLDDIMASFADRIKAWRQTKEALQPKITYLKDELVEILGDDKTKKTLVIGLGNWNITSDALGPKSVSKTLVTRHIFKNYNKDYDDDFTEVSALSPGVMGITGLETSETVKSIVDMIKPDRVIAIDALASRKMERVNSTIQISTAGISPGGGVGNKRKALNKDYLGVDVIAIGVPTVVDAATLTSDVLDLAIDNLMSQSNEGENFYNMLKQLKEDEKYHLIKESLDPYDKNLIVTPKDIDETIENLSIIISEGLNRSLHPGRITN